MYTFFTNYFDFYWKRRLLMKLSIVNLVMLIGGIQFLAAKNVKSQDLDSLRVTVEIRNGSLEDLFRQIEQQTSLKFVYGLYISKGHLQISIPRRSRTVKSTLDIGLEGTNLVYQQKNENIVIFPQVISKPVVQNTRVVPLIQRLDRFVAQEILEGQVVDQDGEPLIGVNVLVKGTTQGTATDIDGRFALENVDDNAVLVFSYVGYQTQEVNLSGRANITITMVEDLQTLDEVVVVGYGTQKKVSLTSAVSSLSTKDLVARPSRNIQSALQGQVPGLTVWDQGGSPGAANFFFRIRGTTTLNNNSPLVIVDGVEQRWNDINPNEIETISVLKDASSTAIYGSRAANGVLLITTKRGKAGEFKINYNMTYDLQNLTTVPKHMDTETYLRLQNLAYQNRGSNPLYSEEQINNWIMPGADRLLYPLPNTWFETVIQKNAPMQNHNLTFSGGSDKLTSLVSLNYFDQAGIYPNQDADRYQIRLNNDLVLNDHIRLNADINVRRNSRNNTNFGNLYHQMIHGSQFAVPVYPDGTYGLSRQGHSPLAYSDPELFGSTRIVENYGVINLKGVWNISEHLNFSSQYAFDYLSLSSLVKNPTYAIVDYWNPDVTLKRNDVNNINERRREYLQTTWNNVITYNNSFQRNEVTILGGYSEIFFDEKNVNALGRDFYNNDILNLGQSDPENRSVGSSYLDWGLRSFFGRVNYSFDEKYLFEFNMRYDGSSRFPEENRYTFFPSVSGAWRLSSEQFWGNLENVVDLFKIRMSWGKSGNQNVGLYTYYSNLAVGNHYVFNDVPVTGVRQTDLASQNLTWEVTSQTNIGVDFSLFGNIDVTFDWFDKQTEGILLDLPIPGVVGLDPVPTNAGVVQNKGWEFLLTYRNSVNELNFSLNTNLSDVENKVVDLFSTGPYYSGERQWYITAEGHPIDALWAFRSDGYYTQKDFEENYPLLAPDAAVGDIKYLDINNDGVINADDREIVGSTLPRFVYGIGVSLDWRAFDLNIQFQGVGKQDMAIVGAFTENGSWEGFALDIGKDYWTAENPNAKFPRPQKQTNKNLNPSDFWVVNASYLRLKNFQFGYSIPSNIIEKINIRNLRAFIGGTNLLSLSKLNEWGTDAETITGRTDYYQPVKTYSFGFNVEF